MATNAEIEKLAKGLMATDGYSLHSSYNISDGFQVPLWISYVSEAKNLLREQAALKTK